MLTKLLAKWRPRGESELFSHREANPREGGLPPVSPSELLHRSFAEPIFKVLCSPREQLLRHVLGYAEMLHAWGLMQKRAELLKSAAISDRQFLLSDPGELGMTAVTLATFHTLKRILELESLCQKCFARLNECHCPTTLTHATRALPECVVCRSTVKGEV